MKQKVSDIISIEDIESWNIGDIITITAGTGQGKSYFIKNKLYNYCKENGFKILFLIHRKECLNQFQMELEHDGKNDVIDIMTYQKLEYKIRKKYEFNLKDYHYIVCDEYHYWMEGDASFNKFTDLSLKAVMDSKYSIRILMSATAERTKSYINKNIQETIPYELPINFNHIRSLNFYNKDETLDEFMRLAIKNNIKAIFFIESAKKAYELHKRYKDYSIFNCSESNPNYYDYVDKEAINKILTNEKFEDKLVLITTMTMSTGINIVDDELKNIVVDCRDVDTIIQCIGRKRIVNKDDKINVCIKSLSNQQLGGIITQLDKKIEMAKYFREHGINKFLHEYQRESDKLNILYDDMENGQLVKKLNMLMFSRYLIDIVDIQSMVGNYGKRKLKLRIKYGYCKFIARKLGFWDAETNEYDYAIWEDDKKNNQLENYLESIVGQVMLQASDKKELIEKVNVKQNGKLLKSLDSLNSALKERGIDYCIKQFETSRIINDKKKKFKSAWKVLKMVDK